MWKSEEQDQESKKESTESLGECSTQMLCRYQGHAGDPEVGAQQHSQPAQPEAYDGCQILNLRGPEQTGDPGTQQKTNDDVFGPANVPEAIAEAIENQICQKVPDRNDRQRGQGGLHPSCYLRLSSRARW